MSDKEKGRNDSFLGVIQIAIWIFWIHEVWFLKTDNSKLMDGFRYFQDMSEKIKGRNDSFFGVIRNTFIMKKNY